jgi:hypothetical protein
MSNCQFYILNLNIYKKYAQIGGAICFQLFEIGDLLYVVRYKRIKNRLSFVVIFFIKFNITDFVLNNLYLT